MDMIEKNIFRPLPNVKKSNLGFAETGIDQEEEMDPAWPHLQGIYEFFLQLVINESVEVRSLKVYVTPQFVQEFLELFDSEESVERDYLKNILHKLYAKVSTNSNLRFTHFSALISFWSTHLCVEFTQLIQNLFIFGNLKLIESWLNIPSLFSE